MIRIRWILSAAICASLVGGCDDPKQTSATPDPAAKPVDAVPATQPTQANKDGVKSTTGVKPAATQPVVTSTFRIFNMATPNDIGVVYEFPRARLHINSSDNTAVLYSDDPKSALKTNYNGNNYYMVIPLDKDDPLRLNGYQWQFKAPSDGEHRDSADGIFIDGQRYHLQPSDVTVAFKVENGETKVAVVGHFTKFDTMSNQADQVGCPVYLRGIVVTKIDSEK